LCGFDGPRGRDASTESRLAKRTTRAPTPRPPGRCRRRQRRLPSGLTGQGRAVLPPPGQAVLRDRRVVRPIVPGIGKRRRGLTIDLLPRPGPDDFRVCGGPPGATAAQRPLAPRPISAGAAVHDSPALGYEYDVRGDELRGVTSICAIRNGAPCPRRRMGCLPSGEFPKLFTCASRDVEREVRPSMPEGARAREAVQGRSSLRPCVPRAWRRNSTPHRVGRRTGFCLT